MKFIYRFHANVECRLRLSGWSYRKNFDFTQTWGYSMSQTRKKWDSLVLSRADF